MMPTVSTIIPVYNGGPYIGQAIDSVLAQKNVELEVIVVDDGSTDNTWEVLEGYGDRIRKFRQANASQAVARNTGVRQARGDWLAFLDADDAWMSDKLVKQLALATEAKSLIYTNCRNFGDCTRTKELSSDNVMLHEGDVFESLLLDNFISTSSVLFRKRWFDQLGGFSSEPFGCEDWDLWLRYTATGGLVGLCREPLTRYRIHGSSTTSKLEKMCGGRLKVLERATSLPRAQTLSPRVWSQAWAKVWECSASFAVPTRRWLALRWYLRSAYHWPWNAGVYKGMVKCCLGMS